MRTTEVDKIIQLQRKSANVRNICILAHVDHGKTTLADALVASNGIISQRMAGKLRYMDSREDEQIRGITMKSSAISLHFQKGRSKNIAPDKLTVVDTEEYLVNLIDSPGHVDFSSEVSTAVRLCDGAIVVVDVVEGVCPQTHAVLRQAWLENIKPVLVLNKIDRLITELKMETLAAFRHLQQILVQVNLLTSELFTADVMSMQTTGSANGESTDEQTRDWTEDADEYEDRNIYFSPDQGNVIFASSLDGWGFTIGEFAELYSKKLGMSEAGLRKTLWGDYYLNMKTKRVMKGAQSKGKKPLFVQFVLENIWSVYDAVLVRRDKEMTEKIVTSLNLKIAPRDSRHSDPRVQLTAITAQWLPVSRAVLSAVVDKLPSPLSILEDKVEKLMCSQAQRFDSMPEETQKLKQDFLACSDKEDAPVIVFISKMVPVEKKLLPHNKQRLLTEEELQRRHEQACQRYAAKLAGTSSNVESESQIIDQSDGEAVTSEMGNNGTNDEDHVFIAFARVFSGTVKKGQKLYVLGPKHNPARALEELVDGDEIDSSAALEDLLDSGHHISTVTVKDLYLFMGRELETLESVPAGNVLGIGGLEDHILKSGTISSTVACPAFTDLYFDAFPILRVALEPVHAGDMKHLVRGLKLLNQADPCVQVLVQETGEHVIVTAGEVHLRRCLDDLQDRYAKIEISASSPIVPFRETIIPRPTIDMVNESIQEQNQVTRNERWKEFEEDEEVIEEGLVRIYTRSKSSMVQIRALPLPPEVTDILENSQFLIKTLDQYVSACLSGKGKSKLQQGSKLKESTKEDIREFKNKLEKAFSSAGKQWNDCVNEIWAFGPRRVGPNLLLNKVEGYNRLPIWNCLESDSSLGNYFIREYDSCILSGFQLATLTGPLCDEPLRGVCFIVEKWEILTAPDNSDNITDSYNSEANSQTDLVIASSEVNLKSHIGTLEIHLENVQLVEKSNSVEGQGQVESSDIEVSNLNQTDVSCDNRSIETTEANENANETLPNVVRYKRQRSSKISESGSIHDLELEKVTDLDSDDDSVTGKRTESQGNLSGQLISIAKDGCRKAFQTQPQRLMAAMYKCTVQCTTEALGKLYAVIGKRNGRIVGDDMREGTQMFSIEAVIPVVESFGFSESIRKKTSGLASPQLVFSHWEVVDVDPFWVPTTEEEIMHYGEKADTENRALVYMNNVRERKGLKVDKKIVEHAEKQRTLTKMK